jgi:glycosyltransferase involved in cell wall biosynthesis
MSLFAKISIIVISHNEERNISECLESLLSLDYPKDSYEIIIVDSSNDGTRDIVRKYQGVRLFLSDHKGFSPKRNVGIREAHFELIAFIDADCIAPPQWLNKIQIKIHDQKVGAVTSSVLPPPNSPFIGKLIACLGKPGGGAIGYDSYFKKLERGIDSVATGNSLFKRSVLTKVGGFDEQTSLYAGGEDWDISKRILATGDVLEFEPDAFVYHKTRNLKQFIKWSFRNGVAQYLYYRKNDDVIRVLLSPFSLLWVVIFLLALMVLPYWVIMMFLGTAIIVIGAILIFGRRLFPTGRKKLRLLIERRKRIGISLSAISLFVIPLSYLDRLIMNCGQIYCILRKKR